MRTDSNAKPMVSIIVCVTGENRSGSVLDLIESFEAQQGPIEAELIVVDRADEQTHELYKGLSARVRHVEIEKRAPEPYMLNIGLREARGAIIAFTEDHVVLPPAYVRNLAGVFSEGRSIAGGPVANGNPGVLAGWAAYFSEYNKWLPGTPDGPVDDLPGSNYAYLAKVLEEFGPLPEGPFGGETFLNKRAREMGLELWFSNSLEVEHVNEVSITKFWKKRFRYGRHFAARRGFGLTRRLAYIVASPLVAVVEYLRILKHSTRDRALLAKFVQCTPLLIPTLLIWTAGELTGYLTGAERRARAD